MENDSVALEIKGLKKSFDTKVVLNGLSLSLKSGEIVAVLGASGSGKSVLLKTIVGLVRPDAGSIRFKNQDLAVMNENEFYKIRAEIGYVFQDGALFDSLTVQENLEYPMKLHSCWVEDQSVAFINERLESLDIAGTNSLYPDELSGGMRKRVGLLRATMLQPKLILLDEPTAGLDPANIARFTRIVEMIKVTRGISAIFVTHDLTSAFAISDRVALLHNGILRAVGTPQEMKNSTDPIVKDFLFPQYRWKAQASQ